MMNVPEIRSYDSYPVFFRDFFKANEKLSHRGFAQKLKWPVSLLSDLIHGHRGLSVGRAVEFAQYFNWGALKTRHLVMLALKDDRNPAIAQFFRTYVDEEVTTFLGPQTPTDGDVRLVTAEQLRDLGPLHAFLVWTGGKTSPLEITRLMDLHPELADPGELEKRLTLMRQLGIIEGELPHVQVLCSKVLCAEMPPKTTLEMIKPLYLMADKPARRGRLWLEGHLTIARRDYSELCQRMETLAKWMQDRAEYSSDQMREEAVIVQVNFFLTHILNLNELGLKITASPGSRLLNTIVAEA